MKTFLCKAILNKEKTSEIGMDWATSKRCLLKIADDYIETANIKIPFSEIQSATLRIVPSAFFIPGCILSVVNTTGTVHHFGLRYSSYWKGDLPFMVERLSSHVPLLWPRRILILAILFWFIWKIFNI
ncbi:MAG: hypothetical protein WC855_10825 [Thermodesulfovibrionales bacterium]